MKQTNNTITILEIAKDYLQRGWQPIPIAHQSKNPNLPGWQNLKLNESDLANHFNGKPQNIGVLLGSKSHGLTDIDLDSPEAIKIADFFLPANEAIFGRISKPRSHRLYISDFPKIEKFEYGESVVEIRSTGGQTVFPPSTHESGEQIEWQTSGEPLNVEAESLRRAVAKLASACIISKFWRDGIRHELSLAVSGAFLRNGFTESETVNFIRAVCFASGDIETSDRLKAVETTAESLHKNKNVFAFPKLAELTSEKLVATVCKWLEIENRQESKTEENSQIETRIKYFPVPNEKCFYGLAGDFVRLVEPHTEASRMALLAQFLVYFGNIVGRFAFYKVEGDRQHTNCFCVLVGKTASGRKGTSFGRVREVFKGLDEHHEKECLVSGLASGEGLLYHIRDAVMKTDKDGETVVDAGVLDKRLLIIEAEFANVLRVQGREGNTLSAFIRNLWDSGNARSLTKNSPLRTTNAHVSIIGHITQTELLVTLSEVESANGYANRFMFFAVERDKFLPFGSEINEIGTGNLRRRLSEAISFAKSIEQMKLSDEARALWASVYKRLETSRFGYLAKVTQRASPYVLRLSCLFALLDQKSQIEQIHLETALNVWQYSEDSARYIFGERLDDQTAERILTALREKQEDGLTRTEIRELFDKHISKEKLDGALQNLLENNLAEVRKEETKGRPKETWLACVLSVKSVLSPETDTNTQPFNAFNAYDATKENHSANCQNCGLKLELTKDKATLFCPFGCESRKAD